MDIIKYSKKWEKIEKWIYFLKLGKQLVITG
jgi:hypothetical protein